MHSYTKLAILYAPHAAVLITTCTLLLRNRILHPDKATTNIKHYELFEQPTGTLWVPILILEVYAMRYMDAKLPRAKVAIFWSFFCTTFGIQYLSVFPRYLAAEKSFDEGGALGLGMVERVAWMPWEGVAFWGICHWGVWDRGCFGRYEDFWGGEAIDLIEFDESTTEAQKPPSNAHSSPHHSTPQKHPPHLPWPDFVIRWACINVLYSILRLCYLRCIPKYGPYTRDLNNSEYLTMLLAVQLLAFKLVKRAMFIRWRWAVLMRESHGRRGRRTCRRRGNSI